MATIKAKKVILKNRDGEHLIPVTAGTGYKMFDPVLQDHVLGFYESRGLLPQGTYAYKTAIAGERFGYPTFYNKCVEEKEAATATETTLGDNTITMYINANGHQFYDIADKEAIDAWYNMYGRAWFYGVDVENERIFLPRNSKYFRIGDESTVGTNQDAGLPTHTHTRGTMNITGNSALVWDSNSAFGMSGAFYKGGNSAQGVKPEGGATNAYRMYFDASRNWTGSTSAPDNDIYGNSDTVELDSVNMLLYICVGNTESDVAWIDVVNQVKGGVQDIEDKINEGITALGNASDALRMTNVTNCITAVPQTIKHTLSDGTLTIKAGTKVIVPYGTEDLTKDRIATLPLNENYLYKSYVPGLGGTVWLTLDNLKGITDTIPEEPMLTEHYLWVCLDLGNASEPWAGISPNRYFYAKAPAGTTADMMLGVDYTTIELFDVMSLQSYGNIYITERTAIYDTVNYTFVPNNKGQLIPAIKVGDTFLHDNFKVADMQFADGKFFVWAELVGDVEAGGTTTSTAVGYVLMDVNKCNIISRRRLESGTNTTTASNTYTVYYNTDTNLIGITGSDTTIVNTQIYSLPHIIFMSDGTNTFSSITQVFNGIGYIGSTVWVDKGVKGLIPSGRNADGTLNNTEITLTGLVTRTMTETGNYYLGISSTQDLLAIEKTSYKYEEVTNYIYSAGNVLDSFILGEAGLSSGAVSVLNPKQPFRVMDHSDFDIPHIVESYRTTTDWYNVYSDGWIEQGGIIQFPAYTQHSAKAIAYLKPFANKTCNVLAQMYGGGNRWATVNSNVQDLSNTGFTLRMFQVSDNSAVNTHYMFWVAKGY
jgi:hypothetical protein